MLKNKFVIFDVHVSEGFMLCGWFACQEVDSSEYKKVGGWEEFIPFLYLNLYIVI